MGKKYMDTKAGTLESSILGVWQDAAEMKEQGHDGRTKSYKEHRAKLESARAKREEKKMDKVNQKALKKDDPDVWTHLAKWHGMTETNIGMASETELITNNGEIAETLETYLFREGITEEIKLAIEEFQTWLEKHLILTKNLIPHNLVINQQNERIIIKIIDGLGSQAFIPLPNYSNFFAKRYVKRRIQLMWSRIHWDLSGRKGNWK